MFLFSRLTGHKGQQPLTIRFQQRLDPSPHGYRFPRELGPEGGAHATGSRRIRVTRAQIALDDRPQGLTLGRGPCDVHQSLSRLIQCPCDRLDEQVVLALKMPVKAPFFQAHPLHHRPDAAAVPAALTERASGHAKNLLVVLRFVFPRVSHRLRVRPYANACQGPDLVLQGLPGLSKSTDTDRNA